MLKFNKRSNKNIVKGGTHVGIMLSFIIFISFVLFLYIFLGPRMSGGDKVSNLEFLKIQLIEELSEELIIFGVYIEDSASGCIQLIDFLNNVENDNLKVRSDSEILDSYKNGNNLIIDQNIDDDSFLKVYFSEGFEDLSSSSLSCDLLQKDEDYSITYIHIDSIILETKILEIIEEYEESSKGYNEIKLRLGLSFNEFAFDFIYQNQTSIGTSKEAHRFLEVHADEIPILYITNQSEIKSGLLNIKIW